MPRDGNITREKILTAAHGLILEQGYGGMALDAVIEGAGITKGAFFYHFPSKQALALALVERYARLDREHYASTLARAEKLTHDPLQMLLVFVGLFIEEAAAQDMAAAGCLYATFVYQSGLIEADTRQIVTDSMQFWREQMGTLIQAALDAKPPRIPVEAESLVDQFLAVFEGAFVTARGFREGDQLAKALTHYRHYLELLFAVETTSTG